MSLEVLEHHCALCGSYGPGGKIEIDPLLESDEKEVYICSGCWHEFEENPENCVKQLKELMHIEQKSGDKVPSGLYRKSVADVVVSLLLKKCRGTKEGA